MFYEENDNSDIALMYAAVPIVLLVFLFFLFWPRTEQKIPLNDADVYGCYAANVAPSIMLASDGMHILQERFPTIPFHLERQKTGIALTADRPVQVKTVDGHPTYSFYRPGSGTYFPLFHVVNGQRYGAFETINSDGFSVLARDDTSVLTYFRTSNSACSAK